MGDLLGVRNHEHVGWMHAHAASRWAAHVKLGKFPECVGGVIGP